MNLPGTSGLSYDRASLDALRSQASSDPKAAIKAAAKQFEALFMQELMKSMRASTMSTGMLDNDATKMGTEMLDQQFATQMTGMPRGLSEAIAKQLEKQMGTPAATAQAAAKPLAPAGAAGAAARSIAGSSKQSEFVAKHQEAAKAAEAKTGIPATFMVAQAAHESGWGKREIKHVDGSSAHNVFGIKAGANWKGPVAEVTTTEYVDGVPRRTTAKFRAYASYSEAFADYAKLMKNSPRYSGVVAHAASAEGFAQGLQKAGYATDPAYADKLTRVINTTLRLQRGLA